MIAMNFSPPPVAHDAATQLAQVYLAAAVDPVATRTRLDELNAATQAYRAAVEEHVAAKKQAEDAASAAAEVERRAGELDQRAAALANERTQLDVASSANAARAKTLDDREAEVTRLEQEFAAKVKGHEDRIASVRASLA